MTRVLIIRLDAIGDAILWCGAMPGVRAAFGDAEISIVCSPATAPIYETCPFIDEVIAVDPRALGADDQLRIATGRKLSALYPDVVLHPVRSRERNAEALVNAIVAPIRISLESDTANCTAEERKAFDATYTRIVPSPGDFKHELERHADFLAGLADSEPAGPPLPRVWLTDADRDAADGLLSTIGADPSRTIAFFPTARWRYKLYPAWVEALSAALAGRDDVRTVAMMGDADGAAAAETLARRLASRAPLVRFENLFGRTTIREAIAIIERCRLCVGNDTFSVHAAAAFDVPSATVMGGGHPGRFLPYHRRGVVACLPMECYGCDWWCRYERSRCVEDLPPAVAAAAIRSALEASADGAAPPRDGKPRVFVPADSIHLPSWLAERVEIVRIPVAQPAADIQVTIS